MNDPIELLADQELAKLAADLQVQLEKGTALRPVLFLLNEQRRRAANALVMMMDVDPTDVSAIMRLQADAKLYDDMVSRCRNLISEGKAAYSRITEAERLELEEAVMAMTEEERRLHKLEVRRND